MGGGKMREDEIRMTTKKYAWFEMRDKGWKTKLWGKRGKFLRVRDRKHQLNVFYYILRHGEQGAWVWYYTPPKDADAPK
jgi:hypothetical protein